MKKNDVRKQFLSLRNALTSEDKNLRVKMMLQHFRHLSLPPLRWVHTYLAMHASNEIDTSPMLRYLEDQHPDVRFCVPVTDFSQNQLINVAWHWQTAVTHNRYGIPEPVVKEPVDPLNIDVVFVPLLAFDTLGFRVGYGKGFYDRFLQQCRTDVVKIGFSYFAPVQRIVDTQYFDIPLSYCITPERIYEFS